jgi:hypothetical protein
MVKKVTNENYEVVWLVRRLFRALAQKASENLGHYELTVADRAVMEFLYPHEQLSVPEIRSIHCAMQACLRAGRIPVTSAHH